MGWVQTDIEDWLAGRVSPPPPVAALKRSLRRPSLRQVRAMLERFTEEGTDARALARVRALVDEVAGTH